MAEPMACDECGRVVEMRDLEDLGTQTLGPVRGLAPGRCEPAEYVTRCGQCGATESFQPAVRCAECGEYPCDCIGPAEPRARRGARPEADRT
ncbi:MAG: hypothetical protein ISS78_12125 [Phycisphaerae bacterium]|nr:hypothetical protein [Phycisphaerae bacterium]